MKVGVSIYPSDNDQDKKIENYIDSVNDHGIDILFSSIHLTEYDLIDQLKKFVMIARQAKKHEMRLIVDISGKVINQIIEDESLLKFFNSFNIDTLRLDYGVDDQLIRKINDKTGIESFWLNASMTNDKDIRGYLNVQLPNLRWEACHNFYPRPQTGLNKEFITRQYHKFKEFNLPVYAFISCLDNPRGPLFFGLPTLEEHRTYSIDKSYYDYVDNKCCNGIIIGDPFVSNDNLKILSDCINDRPLVLTLIPDLNITEAELATLLDKVHKCRYDVNENMLRLVTSRMISEKSVEILPRDSYKRERGMVTIDNIGYKRYSGELQIVLKNLDIDHNVNVLGRIIDDDLWKIPHIACGHRFYFVIKGKL
ncbi:MAG: MupG family TIM beta-alpha barrel fold protein [Erysipelotrichaceae bacterium]|nr:MupG family TIM beta-alpha barrel fold protein [Erysipelotrichaceae bacterium]MDD3923889.1 MupG family TIM beta-alpha barrel fold protein [Erysipelotrichaceae bacterium]MDD4642020.1 MupG family TIM beta-alpha barrel fold protein [Erysipelotrichaceae bacterium]